MIYLLQGAFQLSSDEACDAVLGEHSKSYNKEKYAKGNSSSRMREKMASFFGTLSPQGPSWEAK